MPSESNKAKRVQVDKDKTIIFGLVAVAAVLLVGSLMVGRSFSAKANYLGRVAEQKGIAVDQLKANKANLDGLKAAYKTFDEQSPNLLGGNPEGTSDRDGSNSALVLDALPSKYDFPALTASLEKLLFGYRINGISGSDDALAQEGAAGGAPIEMLFGLDVTSSYDGFKQLISAFDRSIRPIQITRLELAGTNQSLTTTIQAKTYYQPERGMQVVEKAVQ